MKLNLGVFDVAYTAEPTPTGRRKKKSAGSVTTGDVAEILEAKYGIMQYFFDNHADAIAELVAQRVAGQLENMMMGAPPPTVDEVLLDKIMDMFKHFLDSEEMRGAGIPTAAAMKGASKRFKRRRGPPRPSFIDSGQFQAAFAAWLSN